MAPAAGGGWQQASEPRPAPPSKAAKKREGPCSARVKKAVQGSHEAEEGEEGGQESQPEVRPSDQAQGSQAIISRAEDVARARARKKR